MIRIYYDKRGWGMEIYSFTFPLSDVVTKVEPRKALPRGKSLALLARVVGPLSGAPRIPRGSAPWNLYSYALFVKRIYNIFDKKPDLNYNGVYD